MTEFSIREGGRVVWEQGHFVEGAPGINGARYDAVRADIPSPSGRVTFEVGSGHYAFQLTGQ